MWYAGPCELDDGRQRAHQKFVAWHAKEFRTAGNRLLDVLEY